MSVDGLNVLLTSDPAPLNESYCPRQVELTCTCTALPTLSWYYENGSEFAKFIPTEDITSPENLSYELPGVEILIVSAMQVAPLSDNFNMTSTLRGNTSSIRRYFNGMTIRCGTIQTRDSTGVDVNIEEVGEGVNVLWKSYIAMYVLLASSSMRVLSIRKR